MVGSLRPTGLRPSFVDKFEKHGITLPISLFQGGPGKAPLVGVGA